MADKHAKDDHEASAGRGHGGGGHAAHGGGGHEEHEGAPEWLISFADNVMLQMGFFVILLALNLKPLVTASGEGQGTGGQPTPQMLDWVLAVRDAFNNPVSIDSTAPEDAPLVARLRELARGSFVPNPGAPGQHEKVQSVRPGEIEAQGVVVQFARGESDLTPSDLKKLDELVNQIRGVSVVARVVGHCSAAEAAASDDRGMQLSYARARAVAAALVERGVSWKQIRLAASGDADRVADPEYSDFDRAANQRVEVILTAAAQRE